MTLSSKRAPEQLELLPEARECPRSRTGKHHILRYQPYIPGTGYAERCRAPFLRLVRVQAR